MARICIVPWPEWGHVMPPLRVANYLIQRGHHVSMIIPRSFTERVEAAGIEAVWWRDERYVHAHAMTRSAGGTDEFEAGDRILSECVAENTEGGMLRELLERGRYDLVPRGRADPRHGRRRVGARRAACRRQMVCRSTTSR